MVKKKKGMKLGELSFAGIIVLSIIAAVGLTGTFESTGRVLLLVFGLIAGVLNIKPKEAMLFMVSMIAINAGIGITLLGIFGPLSGFLNLLMSNLLIGFGAMTLVVAVPIVLKSGRD